MGFQQDPVQQFARLARPEDATAVRLLDDAAFPVFSLDKRRADPGVLEAAVGNGQVYVAEAAGQLVGYLHAEPGEHQLFISGLGVHPDWQGRGLGTSLLDHLVTTLRLEHDDRPVVTVTSPRNIPMLRVLFRFHFEAAQALYDFFGPQETRLGCVRLPGVRPSSDVVARVPLTAIDRLLRLLDRGLAATGFHGESAFLLGPPSTRDAVTWSEGFSTYSVNQGKR